MPPCSGQSRPSPSGGREDAASLDRPCARRRRDLRSGRKNARGAGRTKEWPEQENAINRDRRSLLCPDASPSSAWFLTAIHIWHLALRGEKGRHVYRVFAP